MTYRVLCVLALLLTLGLLGPNAAVGDDQSGCGGSTTMWTFMQGNTHLSTNVDSTTAHAQANLACDQTWTNVGHHVTPVGTWWTEVQQGFSTWLLWCRVCIDGSAPVFSNDTFETPVSIDGAIQLVEAHNDGKVTGISLVHIDTATSCSDDSRRIPAFVVTVVEDDIMKKVVVNARTGEMSSSVE